MSLGLSGIMIVHDLENEEDNDATEVEPDEKDERETSVVPVDFSLVPEFDLEGIFSLVFRTTLLDGVN